MQDYKSLEDKISEMPKLDLGVSLGKRDEQSLNEELKEINEKIYSNNSLLSKIYDGIKKVFDEFLSTIYTPNLAERRDKTVKELQKSKQSLHSKLKTSDKTVNQLSDLETNLNDKLIVNRQDLDKFQKYLIAVEEGITYNKSRMHEDISLDEEAKLTSEIQSLTKKKREALGKLSIICSGIKTSNNLLKRTEAQRVASENIHYVLSERLAAVSLSYEYMRSTKGVQDYLIAIKVINDAKLNLDSAELIADQFDEYLGQGLELVNIDVEIFQDNGELSNVANRSWEEKESSVKKQLAEVRKILGE